MPVIAFTDRTIAGLSNPGRVVDYWDVSFPGLAVRVTQRGRKAWIVRYRVDETQRRLMLGHFPAMSLVQARREAKIKLDEAGAGQDPALVERAANAEAREAQAEERLRQRMTVREMADEYLERHAKPNKRSWKGDEAILNHDVLPVIGELNPKFVERSHIIKMLNAAVDRGAPVQANRILEIVRKMFNWAATRDYVEQSPCFGVKKPTKEIPRERNLSRDEIRAIWRLVETGYAAGDGRRVWMEEPLRIAIKLLLLLGQRPGEVAEALQSEFDIDEAMWTIPGGRTKNGRLHRVPLPPLALSLVEDAKKLASKNLFLFPTTSWTKDGKPGVKSIGDTAINHALKRVLPGARIENVRPHDFRESVATGMASLGVDEIVIAALLNHVQASITRRHYNRYRYEKEKRAALELREAELLRIVSVQPDRKPNKKVCSDLNEAVSNPIPGLLGDGAP